jgi:hypothetical protein
MKRLLGAHVESSHTQFSVQAVRPGRPGGPGGARPNAKYSVVYSRIGIDRACGAPDRISSISFISLEPWKDYEKQL